MKNIILIAPPAAGKGTQSLLIKDKYNMMHISTGDLLRVAKDEDSDTGRLIKSLMEEGKLVTDEIINDLLKNKLSETNNGFILDGYPRNIEQAKALDDMLESLDKKIDNVIVLDLPKEEALKRVCGRRLCTSCDAIYNIFEDSMKPKEEGICDSCGNALYQRTDDNEETFGTRFDTYLEKTAPLIDFYKDKGILEVVDSSINKEHTFNQIKEILDK